MAIIEDFNGRRLRCAKGMDGNLLGVWRVRKEEKLLKLVLRKKKIRMRMNGEKE